MEGCCSRNTEGALIKLGESIRAEQPILLVLRGPGRSHSGLLRLIREKLSSELCTPEPLGSLVPLWVPKIGSSVCLFGNDIDIDPLVRELRNGDGTTLRFIIFDDARIEIDVLILRHEAEKLIFPRSDAFD